MGLLGDLFGKVAGSGTGASSEHTAINSIFELLNHNQIGGLEGLVSKMTNGGLGNIINSWISTGKNESINSNQISNVLGSDVIGQFASKLGISPDEAKDKIATYLPMIVDKLTPNGNITSTGQVSNIQDILGSILNK
jgi:uncharacterized protein YidB (DUF937 family)